MILEKAICMWEFKTGTLFVVLKGDKTSVHLLKILPCCRLLLCRQSFVTPSDSIWFEFRPKILCILTSVIAYRVGILFTVEMHRVCLFVFARIFLFVHFNLFCLYKSSLIENLRYLFSDEFNENKLSASDISNMFINYIPSNL